MSEIRRGVPSPGPGAAPGGAHPGERACAARVLVLEPDEELGRRARRVLEETDHRVDLAADPDEARRLLASNRYDVLLVDTTLGSSSGYEFVAELRDADREEPVLLLSGSRCREELVLVEDRGRENGGPDLTGLPSRVADLLGRPPPSGSPWRVRYGSVEVDRLRDRVWVDGSELSVTPTEYRILEQLVLHGGAVVSEDSLLEAVWAGRKRPGSNALAVHLANLRRKLDAGGIPGAVETVRGEGYRLGDGEDR